MISICAIPVCLLAAIAFEFLSLKLLANEHGSRRHVSVVLDNDWKLLLELDAFLPIHEHHQSCDMYEVWHQVRGYSSLNITIDHSEYPNHSRVASSNQREMMTPVPSIISSRPSVTHNLSLHFNLLLNTLGQKCSIFVVALIRRSRMSRHCPSVIAELSKQGLGKQGRCKSSFQRKLGREHSRKYCSRAKEDEWAIDRAFGSRPCRNPRKQ